MTAGRTVPRSRFHRGDRRIAGEYTHRAQVAVAKKLSRFNIELLSDIFADFNQLFAADRIPVRGCVRYVADDQVSVAVLRVGGLGLTTVSPTLGSCSCSTSASTAERF